MCSPKDLVPIYHLHGIRTNPDSIIISQEDYVSLFRPNEYRQIKLALTIKESTVLFIGYGLGDVNVLTALDWSKHVFRTDSNNYPNDVIQLVRKDNPSENPYRDHNGIVILEVGSLEKFFESFLLSNDKFLIEKENSRLVLVELSSRLENPDGDLVKRFIDEEKFRREILGLLAQFPSEIIAGFVSFLSKCIDETWVRAEPPGAFYAYNENLNILIDILTVLKIDQIPPALLETVAYHLNRVGYYVGDKLGMSHEANKTFNARKSELSKEIVQELNSIADQHWYFSLKNLLNRI